MRKTLFLFAFFLTLNAQSITSDQLDKLTFRNIGPAVAGGRIHDVDSLYKYEAYVDADFDAGGMENSDSVSKDKALLREIVEERYVSGFGSWMPFDDHRRLRGAGETDLVVPFPLNTAAAAAHVERLHYAQDEISSNSNAPGDKTLFDKTEVNK